MNRKTIASLLAGGSVLVGIPAIAATTHQVDLPAGTSGKAHVQVEADVSPQLPETMTVTTPDGTTLVTTAKNAVADTKSALPSRPKLERPEVEKPAAPAAPANPAPDQDEPTQLPDGNVDVDIAAEGSVSIAR